MSPPVARSVCSGLDGPKPLLFRRRQIVPDTVQAILEAEVGTTLPDTAYKRVRERVDQTLATFGLQVASTGTGKDSETNGTREYWKWRLNPDSSSISQRVHDGGNWRPLS